MKHHAESKPTSIASSLVSDDEVLSVVSAGGEEIPQLLGWIEEADARIVLHVNCRLV